MHLDPDFENLTYGDCHPRSLPINDLQQGDFLVFYAGLRSIKVPQNCLCYAIIGFYVVNDIVRADSIPSNRWHENAHTRRKECRDDTVVRAQKGSSGRLARCIDIGEFRNHAYRVQSSVLAEWGGLSVTDGYIQRSARLPHFRDPASFVKWFQSKKPDFMERNNE